MAECKVFWDEAMKMLRSEYEEKSNLEEFNFWLSVMEYVDCKGSVFTVSVPSRLFRDNLTKERNDIQTLSRYLSDLTGQQITIDLVIRERSQTLSDSDANSPVSSASNTTSATSGPVPKKPAPSAVSEIQSQEKHPLLKTEYTFDNFVIGNDNNFAYNAALAVAKNPGRAYNPVLIYGGVGLGKTHLMQAIGNYAWQADKKAKIIYKTAEEFTNEFVEALTPNSKDMQKFKNKYRTADILLIDDIHFFSKKDGLQEEMFHTFNALYDSYKQLVFTCDRPVSELKNLTDRLRSRFERGLNVNLDPPGYELRKAILLKKLDQMNKSINPEVIDFIAENVVSNVRDLEASLTKIIFYTDVVQKEVTVEIAAKLLKDTLGPEKQLNISIDDIIKAVANHYNLSFADVKGKKRTKNIMMPRQIAMYIAREITEYSTTELGAEFNKDHTTVMHACQKIEESIKNDSQLESNIELIIRNLKEQKKST
ncbi:MAG: chromosomal replication initiator protein DnaA [Treponema sp.]|nr:chromosomal replication initiator protein DnaA [Candidatus Treponema caballi]